MIRKGNLKVGVWTLNLVHWIKLWYYWPILPSSFKSGPRELTGAIDLISQYRLLPHYEFFCKRPLPASISDTHYLQHVVGDTEIRRGEGMELQQLIQDNNPLPREIKTCILPFDLDMLSGAFQLKEAAPVYLPPVGTFYSLGLRILIWPPCDSFTLSAWI